MRILESISGFLRRRQGERLRVLAKRVTLVNFRKDSPRGNFIFPGCDYVDIIKVGELNVGRVEYGINPLVDRLYINMIEIHPDFRRQGLGLGVLWLLWSIHRIPIIPLHEYGTSHRFWNHARQRFAGTGGEVGHELRGEEAMNAERARWQHLIPEPEHERLIRELKASPEWPAIQARWSARESR